MREVAEGLAPLGLLWLTLAIIAMVHRRGRTVKRWRAIRDLRRPGRATHYVNVSAAAAAAIVGGRTRNLVNVAYLIGIFWIATLPLPRIVGVLIVLVGLPLAVESELRLAQAIYRRLTGTPSPALTIDANRYFVISENQAGLRRLMKRTVLAGSMQVLGYTILASSGLALYFHSDAISIGVPHFYIRHSGLPPAVAAAISLALGLSLVRIGVGVERRIRRREMARMTSLTGSRDRRQRTVLFLRQFGTETITVPHHHRARDLLARTALAPRRSTFLEEAITWVCWSFGAVVSITDPRNGRDRVLASGRHPVPVEDDWQAAVTELIHHSLFVVLVVGDGDGIRWEMREVLRSSERAQRSIFLNAYPDRPAPFLKEIERLADMSLMKSVPPHLLVIGVTFADGRAVPICSNLAEDVDYESAVLWLTQSLELQPQSRSKHSVVSEVSGP